jgi:hypothetical protein
MSKRTPRIPNGLTLKDHPFKMKSLKSKSACGLKTENELIHLQYGGLPSSQGEARESIE